MRQRGKRWLLVMLLSMGLAAPAAALAAHEVTLGAGVGVGPDYEGAENYRAVPLLYARAKCDSGRFVEFTGRSLKLNALPSRSYTFGPVLQYRWERGDVENDHVDALKNVDAALEGGVFAGADYHGLQLGVQWVHDLVDSHGGHLTTPSLGYRWRLSETLTLVPSVHATYASGAYMHTYFGVDADNAGASGYAPYRARAGWKDAGISLAASYRLGDRWGISARAGFSRLQGDAKDSPLVADQEGRTEQFFGGLMLTCKL